MADNFKFVLAALIVSGGIAGFYYYGDQMLLMRVLGLLAAAGIATAVFLQTALGRQTWAYMGEARTEVRKVVWPTRKETVQSTLVVMAMVVLIAIILWIFDWILTQVVRMVMDQGG